MTDLYSALLVLYGQMYVDTRLSHPYVCVPKPWALTWSWSTFFSNLHSSVMLLFKEPLLYIAHALCTGQHGGKLEFNLLLIYLFSKKIVWCIHFTVSLISFKWSFSIVLEKKKKKSSRKGYMKRDSF